MAIYICKPWYEKSKYVEPDTWESMNWNGRISYAPLYGGNVWTYDDNIYYSQGRRNEYSNQSNQKKLIRNTNEWVDNNWFLKGIYAYHSFDGNCIWTDGTDVYNTLEYDSDYCTYKYDKSNDRWNQHSWARYSNIPRYGYFVWNDGINTYYSDPWTGDGQVNWSFNKNDNIWGDTLTYRWNVTDIKGDCIWKMNSDIYMSYGTTHYKFDKINNRWQGVEWYGLNGINDFNGGCVWTDGTSIFYSNGNTQKVLDINTNTWKNKTWKGYKPTYGSGVWADGDNIYYSGSDSGNPQYRLVQSV